MNTTAADDSDGDRMVDDWEARYSLNPTNAADAALDMDEDGFINWQEHVAGTDPTNAASRLRIAAPPGITRCRDASRGVLEQLQQPPLSNRTRYESRRGLDRHRGHEHRGHSTGERIHQYRGRLAEILFPRGRRTIMSPSFGGHPFAFASNLPIFSQEVLHAGK